MRTMNTKYKIMSCKTNKDGSKFRYTIGHFTLMEGGASGPLTLYACPNEALQVKRDEGEKAYAAPATKIDDFDTPF